MMRTKPVTRCPARPFAQQQGMVLVVALVMLGSLSLIAVAAMSGGIGALLVSRNVQEQGDAFQIAQSALDVVMDTAESSNDANLPQDEGTYMATTLSGEVFTLDTGETVTAGAELLSICREQVEGSSGNFFANYEVRADVDRTVNGRGRARLRQGYQIVAYGCATSIFTGSQLGTSGGTTTP